MAELEPERGRGLIAVAGEPERIVAHAAYIRETPDRAEVAFEVADDWQGRGIATVLLAHLSELATADGIETFTAIVLPENHRMIQVFRDSGFAVEVRARAERARASSCPPRSGDEARARFEERDRVAAAAAVSHVLRPASVAVIGVSEPRGLGRRGRPAQPASRPATAAGSPSYTRARTWSAASARIARSVRSRSRVELAVIAVPAEAVVDVARQCGAAGVRALVVLSAGFAEVGARGRDRQAELLAVCRASGMRLVGPNCLGVLNTAQTSRSTRRSPRSPRQPGSVAFASQSGAFGIAAVAEAARRGLGLSSFVSTGNKADLSGNDLLRFWEADDGDGGDRALPRVVRQPAPVRPGRPAGGGRQAGDRGQERALGGRLACRHVAYRGAPRRVRRDRRRPVPPRGRDPYGHRRRAVRCRRPAGRPAAARGRSRRHRDERRRPRHRLRRRVRGGEAARRAAAHEDAPPARPAPAARGDDDEPRRHDRLSVGGRLSPLARGPCRRPVG